MKKIIVDLLGSDNGQEELLQGVIKADKNYEYILVGDKALIDKTLSGSGISYVAVEAVDFVSNVENPLRVLSDENVSISKCLGYAAEGDALGIVTAGSTGAALVGSAFKLGLKKGVGSPVLCCVLFRFDGRPFCLADCGANIDPQAEDMLNFARLASDFSKSYCSVKEPKVYLLNVGKEPKKGTAVYKAAYSLLKDGCPNFCGNIEADAVFSSDADVIVCDGFSGNVLLKCGEAVAMGIKNKIISYVSEDIGRTISDEIDELFDYNDLAGAVFLGVNKPVIKLHGKANAKTVTAGLAQLIRACGENA